MTGRWEEAFEQRRRRFGARGAPRVGSARPRARRGGRRSRCCRPARGDRALARGDRGRRPGRRHLRERERPHQSLHRQARRGGPDATTCLDIVEAAASVGAHEEAFRAIVNFVWAASGFLPAARDRIGRGVRAERGGCPAPDIAAYLELSIAGMLLVPGRPLGRGGRDPRTGIDGPDSARPAVSSGGRSWEHSRSGAGRHGGGARGARGVAAACHGKRRGAEDRPDGLGRAPLAVPTGNLDELRAVAEETLAMVEGHWLASISVDPLVRTLFAAGERAARRRYGLDPAFLRQQLRGQTRDLAAGRGRPRGAGRGQGRRGGEPLSAATASEDEFGFAFDSACLRLSLAPALERAGDASGAGERRRVAAFVLGCSAASTRTRCCRRRSGHSEHCRAERYIFDAAALATASSPAACCRTRWRS